MFQGAVDVEFRATRQRCLVSRNRLAYVPTVFVKVIAPQKVFEHVVHPHGGKVAKVRQQVRLGKLFRQRRFARIITGQRSRRRRRRRDLLSSFLQRVKSPHFPLPAHPRFFRQFHRKPFRRSLL